MGRGDQGSLALLLHFPPNPYLQTPAGMGQYPGTSFRACAGSSQSARESRWLIFPTNKRSRPGEIVPCESTDLARDGCDCRRLHLLAVISWLLQRYSLRYRIGAAQLSLPLAVACHYEYSSSEKSFVVGLVLVLAFPIKLTRPRRGRRSIIPLRSRSRLPL